MSRLRLIPVVLFLSLTAVGWSLNPADLAAGHHETENENQTPSAGMMRYPDVSQSQIVFSYAGDRWVVDRDGGGAPTRRAVGQ